MTLMESTTIDILTEIPDEDLPSLAALYEKETRWAPHVASLIHTGISWKKTKYANCFSIFSVGNTWREDGTIIILQTNSCYNIFVFTLEEKCENLRRGLIQTNILDYRRENTFFFMIHEKHIKVINQVLEELKMKAIHSKVPYFIYALPPESAHLHINHHTDVYVKELENDSAAQIDALWIHKFKGSENVIRSLIEANGGYGLFTKSTNEMVAWVVRYNLGYFGLLQTVEGWRKRGLATFIIQILTKRIVEEGHWPVATITADNLASIRLFEKIGFKKLGECAFFKVENDAK